MVNDVCADEDWPYGTHCLDGAVYTAGGTEYTVSEIENRKEEEPAVLGEFTDAEGWRPQENVFVGDCMPYTCDGRYHVLYLKDRRHHRSKWCLGAHQWSHISTDDFKHWQVHPMAVEIDDPSEGSICTGSWIREGDTHYLFYTIRSCDGTPAKICRSISKDGYHFEKDRAFAFTLSDTYKGVSARDPKLVLDAQGRYHMFLTTSLTESGELLFEE